ncbi:hypothetical protein BDA99DRAFT_553892 [Phascolomyces articulosus]|uniref:Chitin-binding type-2 domain-containing protein n=1 Tax=Phascolomyces articulosus TaxID=60185 RepID=A0AAD5PK34_9FUNG|nr:hypothetical protein BDA99DRAFT_553892 [Phascolomyces articulosus]
MLFKTNGKEDHRRISEEGPEKICTEYFNNGSRPYARVQTSCTKFYKCMRDGFDKNTVSTVWFQCNNETQFDEHSVKCVDANKLQCNEEELKREAAEAREKSASTAVIIPSSIVFSFIVHVIPPLFSYY